MLVPRAPPKLSEDSQHSAVKRLSLSQPIGLAEQPGQVVEACCHVGMLRAEALFINGERPAVKRLGLTQRLGRAEQAGQVVEACCHVGMLGAEALLNNG